MRQWFKRGDGTLCGRRVTAAVVGSMLALVQAFLGWGCVETARQARGGAAGGDGLTGLTVPMAGSGRTAAEAVEPREGTASEAVAAVRDYQRRLAAAEELSAAAAAAEQEVAWRDRPPVDAAPETLAAQPAVAQPAAARREVERAPGQADGPTERTSQGADVRIAGGQRIAAQAAAPRKGVDDMSEEELVQALADRVAAGERSQLDKALVGALIRAMAVEGAAEAVDARLLSGLAAGKRERVALFEDLVKQTRAGMLASDGSLSQGEAGRRVMRVFEDLPVTVAKMELCRRVEGYGVYEALPSRVFQAGRAKRAVVYLELENFTRQEVETGYEVKLRQAVTLYKADDGMAVWRQKPVEIVDRSKNPRRDFFVVQVVSLPRDLGMGRYVLKVKGQDLHGGMHYARSVSIEVSAVGETERVAVGR
ncbi:MAG: hypothetical protein AAGI68_12620 [Planctomycetota bacterium]